MEPPHSCLREHANSTQTYPIPSHAKPSPAAGAGARSVRRRDQYAVRLRIWLPPKVPYALWERSAGAGEPTRLTRTCQSGGRDGCPVLPYDPTIHPDPQAAIAATLGPVARRTAENSAERPFRVRRLPTSGMHVPAIFLSIRFLKRTRLKWSGHSSQSAHEDQVLTLDRCRRLK